MLRCAKVEPASLSTTQTTCRKAPRPAAPSPSSWAKRSYPARSGRSSTARGAPRSMISAVWSAVQIPPARAPASTKRGCSAGQPPIQKVGAVITLYGSGCARKRRGLCRSGGGRRICNLHRARPACACEAACRRRSTERPQGSASNWRFLAACQSPTLAQSARSSATSTKASAPARRPKRDSIDFLTPIGTSRTLSP